MEISETYIISCLCKKDKEAFRYLYEHYFDKMVLFAESYLYDENEAQDLVQDLFFKLWDQSNILDIKISLKAYLYTSLRNRCLNVLRDKKIRDNNNDKLFEAQLFSGNSDLDIDELTRIRLQQALNSLPDKCREIFLLKIVEGKKNKEIAEELGIADTTVKTQVQRAYKTMREKMIPILFLIEWMSTK